MPSEDPTDIAAAVERLKWRANLAERCADMSENELAADIRTVLAALRLQDAAPQLLAALRELVEAVPGCTCYESWNKRWLRDPDCIACELKAETDKARAAIAAATGEVE